MQENLSDLGDHARASGWWGLVAFLQLHLSADRWVILHALPHGKVLFVYRNRQSLA